ncbi:MAG: class I SAM-dependent methyltransferase [Pseudomonadales bacterium]
MSRLTSEQWSSFWTRSTVTTISSMFEQNYDGAVAEFWHSVLAGEPRTVLDLACGNGALAWLANEYLNTEAQNCSVLGVDAASINPFEVLGRDPAQYPGVSFFGDTPIESLPFDSASIDVAMSQYGLEYSDMDRSVPEIARVLKPGGVMAFIVHGEESSIARGSTRYLPEHKKILEEIAVHRLFSEVDIMIGKRRDLAKIAVKSKVRKKLAAIDEAGAVLQKMAEYVDPPYEIERYYLPMLGAFTQEAVRKGVNRKAVIAKSLSGLRAFIERIEDLQSATLSLSEQAELVALIEAQGFEIRTHAALAYGASPNIGTAIIARKRSGT